MKLFIFVLINIKFAEETPIKEKPTFPIIKIQKYDLDMKIDNNYYKKLGKDFQVFLSVLSYNLGLSEKLLASVIDNEIALSYQFINGKIDFDQLIKIGFYFLEDKEALNIWIEGIQTFVDSINNNPIILEKAIKFLTQYYVHNEESINGFLQTINVKEYKEIFYSALRDFLRKFPNLYRLIKSAIVNGKKFKFLFRLFMNNFDFFTDIYDGVIYKLIDEYFVPKNITYISKN